MKNISYARLQENYAGEYIGRKDNQIIAHAKTYSELSKKLTQKRINRKKLIIGFIPPKGTICIYAC